MRRTCAINAQVLLYCVVLCCQDPWIEWALNEVKTTDPSQIGNIAIPASFRLGGGTSSDPDLRHGVVHLESTASPLPLHSDHSAPLAAGSGGPGSAARMSTTPPPFAAPGGATPASAPVNGSAAAAAGADEGESETRKALLQDLHAAIVGHSIRLHDSTLLVVADVVAADADAGAC